MPRTPARLHGQHLKFEHDFERFKIKLKLKTIHFYDKTSEVKWSDRVKIVRNKDLFVNLNSDNVEVCYFVHCFDVMSGCER